jgi:hypothetical protein
MIVPNFFRFPAQAHADLTPVVSSNATENPRHRITRGCHPFGADSTALVCEADHRAKVWWFIPEDFNHDRFPAAEQRSPHQSLSPEGGVVPSAAQSKIAPDASAEHFDTNGNSLRPFDD